MFGPSADHSLTAFFSAFYRCLEASFLIKDCYDAAVAPRITRLITPPAGLSGSGMMAEDR